MEDTVILTKEIKEKGLYDTFSCVLLSVMAIKIKVDLEHITQVVNVNLCALCHIKAI